MPHSKDCIGYLKYQGELVDDGLLDAGIAGKTLTSFNNSLRFFVNNSFPAIKKHDYQIPVNIQSGSWEVIIPSILIGGVVSGGLIFSKAYLAKAGEKMAENDFEKIGFKDIISKGLHGIIWMLKIGKHLKTTAKKKIIDIKWKNDNQFIGIPDENGEYLFVPIDVWDLYEKYPFKEFEAIAENIEEDRELAVGIVDDNGNVDEVVVDNNHKYIFYSEPEPEVLFPEFKHGQYVELEGHVTRGNENTDSMGFRYEGHILTCYPKNGDVIQYKPQLFRDCIIQGTIKREDKYGNFIELKPKIVFDSLIPTTPTLTTPDLFKNQNLPDDSDEDI